MKIRRMVLSLAAALFVGAYTVALVGCASTKIKRLSGEEFIKYADSVDRLGSFAWDTYIGVSHQRAYLEYGHPAFIGKGTMTTVCWTPLEELPSELAKQLKSGSSPWTNWTTRFSNPQMK